MERHHEAALLNALDDLYLDGFTVVRWDHMYMWFNAQRIGKGAYREIQSRWEELCSKRGFDPAPVLKVIDYNKRPTLLLTRDLFPNETMRPLLELT
jgi:hypothetical protein